MGWFDGVTGFLEKNADWLKPVVGLGLGALKQGNVDNTQKEYINYLKQREDANYQNSINDINAYNAQMQANFAASSANRRAAAGAAAANEAARQGAAKKANKVQQKMYKNLLAMYAPYRQTADQLLPQMTKTYEGSLGLQNSLASLLATPTEKAKFTASVPAWQVNVPLPESVKGK